MGTLKEGITRKRQDRGSWGAGNVLFVETSAALFYLGKLVELNT